MSAGERTPSRVRGGHSPRRSRIPDAGHRERRQQAGDRHRPAPAVPPAATRISAQHRPRSERSSGARRRATTRARARRRRGPARRALVDPAARACGRASRRAPRAGRRRRTPPRTAPPSHSSVNGETGPERRGERRDEQTMDAVDRWNLREAASRLRVPVVSQVRDEPRQRPDRGGAGHQPRVSEHLSPLPDEPADGPAEHCENLRRRPQARVRATDRSRSASRRVVRSGQAKRQQQDSPG